MRELREGLTGHPVGGGERGIAKTVIRQERTWTKSKVVGGRMYAAHVVFGRSFSMRREFVKVVPFLSRPVSSRAIWTTSALSTANCLDQPPGHACPPRSFASEGCFAYYCMWPPKSLLAANSRRDCWGGQLGLPRQLLRFLRVIGRPHANRWLTTRLLTLVPRVRACAGISGISFVGVTQEGGDDVRYFVETFQRPLRAVTILADEQGVLTDGYQVDALPSLVT